MKSDGLRWTLLSFATIGLLVWLSTALLLRAATPAVSGLMGDVAQVLQEGATTIDDTAGIVANGAILAEDLQPGLVNSERGITASTNALRSTQAALSGVTLLFDDLSISLDAAGQELSRTPSLEDAGASLRGAGSSAALAAIEMNNISLHISEIIEEMDGVNQVVSDTAANMSPLVESLATTGNSMTTTGTVLRGTADQVVAVRDSGSLRAALIMLLVLLGTISISLTVIAGSRLTQLGLVQQVAVSAANFPQRASEAARRIASNPERTDATYGTED